MLFRSEMGQATPAEEAKKEIKTVVLPKTSMPTQMAATQEPEPVPFDMASFSPPVMSEGAGSDLENYVIPFGKKYKGQRLVDIGLDNAIGFASWLQNDAATKGKELNGQAAEFVAMTEAWIKKDRGLV